MKSKIKTNNHKSSFFEFTTALAFQYFKEKKVDFAIIRENEKKILVYRYYNCVGLARLFPWAENGKTTC